MIYRKVDYWEGPHQQPRIPGAAAEAAVKINIMHLANSNRPMGNIMRKFSAMMIIAMLASATLVNSAFCAPPPWQYGWWEGDHPHGNWQWRGGWGPGGHWKRHGHQWVYRWR
jgi:hypothetical protein